MSALTDYLLSRPGLVWLAPADEAAASTTLADLGPNTLTGTELNTGVSRNGFGATGFVNGHTRCWASSGTEARGFQIATAANAILQLQSLTFGVFFMQTSANNGPMHVGRQNGISIGATVLRKFATTVQGGGVTQPSRTNPTNMTLSTGHLEGVTYDGRVIQPWLDGVREGSYMRAPGPFTSFLNRFVFGGDTGQVGAGHLLSVAFAFSGAARIAAGSPAGLTEAEWATIYKLGLGDMTADHQASFDFTLDAVSAKIASTPERARCTGCGGRARTGEGRYASNTGTAVHEGHPSCVACAGLHLPDPYVTLSSASSERQLDVAHAALTKAVVDTYTTRPTTDTLWYLGSAGPAGTGVTTQTWGGILTALGVPHRAFSMDPAGPNIQRMKRIMAWLRTNQIPGSGTRNGWWSTDGTAATQMGGNGTFSTAEGLPGIIAVWDIIDSATKALWLDSLRKFVTGLNRDESNFWPNGNYVMFYYAINRMMHHIDPGRGWDAAASVHLNFLFNPQATGIGSGYVGSTLVDLGVYKYVDGTHANDVRLTRAAMNALNPATDKIYQTEGLGGASSHGPAYSTQYGYDPNYVGAAMSIFTFVYMVTKDPEAWQMTQLLANALVDRQNFTNAAVNRTIGGATISVPAWWTDNRGTRHNAAELIAGASWGTLRRLGRPDLITAQQVADRHHALNEPDAGLNTTQQNVWYRTAGNYALELCASRHWPGFPAG